MTISPANSHGAGYPLGLAGATAATRYVGGTATGAPASGTFLAGDMVVAQDGVVWICTVAGSPGTWLSVGAGALTQIADSTLSGAAASFDFQNIPATYNHLMILLSARGSNASNTVQLYVRLNNDATAKYLREYVRGNLDTAEANHSTAVAQFAAFDIAAASATALAPGSGTIWLPDYADTTLSQAIHAQGGGYGGDAAAQAQSTASAGYWNAQAAVNRVTLLPSSGNFAAGSRATVYGLT